MIELRNVTKEYSKGNAALKIEKCDEGVFQRECRP